MIRAIIFDCFGVLYGGSLEYFTSLAPAGRTQEIKDLSQEKDYGFITYEEYVARTGEVIGKTADEVIAIMREKHIRNTELVAYLRELKRRYKIGLLSNVGEKIIDTLFTPEEQVELFDDVFLSYKEGVAKPNPAAFTLMADRLGVSAGECVMIDDLAINCEGAEVAGMQAVQFVSNELVREKLMRILQQNT